MILEGGIRDRKKKKKGAKSLILVSSWFFLTPHGALGSQHFSPWCLLPSYPTVANRGRTVSSSQILQRDNSQFWALRLAPFSQLGRVPLAKPSFHCLFNRYLVAPGGERPRPVIAPSSYVLLNGFKELLRCHMMKSASRGSCVSGSIHSSPTHCPGDT